LDDLEAVSVAVSNSRCLQIPGGLLCFASWFQLGCGQNTGALIHDERRSQVLFQVTPRGSASCWLKNTRGPRARNAYCECVSLTWMRANMFRRSLCGKVGGQRFESARGFSCEQHAGALSHDTKNFIMRAFEKARGC
jgi:hypothetical protein